MLSRRNFVKNLSLLGAGSQLITEINCPNLSPDFSWEELSKQFLKSDRNLLNFNTGSAGMMSIPIYNSNLKHIQALISHAPYEVKQQAQPQVRESMKRLGLLLGVDSKDLALVRNSTEGINSVLFGYPFEKSDEVVISNLCYPYVEYSAHRLKTEKNIVIKKARLDRELSDAMMVESFRKAITPKTKLLVVTYMIHRTGLILPVKAICKMANSHGVEVLIDGAHCIGHIPHNLQDIGCDFYVSSMHKWLSAPLGSGLLYIRNAPEMKLNPLMSYPPKMSDGIKKLDYTGTIPFQNAMTLESVLDFLDKIGLEKKSARIKELSDYLVKKLMQIPNVSIETDTTRSCGIVALAINGVSGKEITSRLEADHDIHVKQISTSGHSCIRVSLDIHLLESDIDRLVKGIQDIAK